METTPCALDIPVNYILGRCTFGNWDDDDEPTTTTLSVLNVCYVVKERVGPWWKGACLRRIRHKLVLRDSCMHLKSGHITAVLGGSGSGKTSLLDCIAQRADGTVSGKVYYNNMECTPDIAQNYMSYVMQADRLLPNLTVRETLRYSAQLRLPGNASNFDIEEKRMTLNVFRDRPSYMLRMFMLSLFVPIICIFLGHLGTNQTSVQDRIGLLYQSSQVPAFVAALNAIGLFPVLRDLYYRECRDGLYSATTFLLAYLLHILPFTIFSTATFCSIVYWVTGLQPQSENFLHYTAIILFLHLFGEIMSVLLMGASMNPALATSNASIILSASGLMASGFLMNVEKMIPIFQWAAWGNIFKYAGEILAANEFHNLQLTCGRNGTFCLLNGDSYLKLVYPDAVENMTRNFWAVTGLTSATFLCVIVVFKIRGIPNLS